MQYRRISADCHHDLPWMPPELFVTEPHLRIKDMDRDSVDAEVMYGILGAAGRLSDTEAANEMLRIYNDWLKDFCRHYPERQIGLACLPYGDIDAAVSEVQ